MSVLSFHYGSKGIISFINMIRDNVEIYKLHREYTKEFEIYREVDLCISLLIFSVLRLNLEPYNVHSFNVCVYLCSSHFVYCDHGKISIDPSVSAL